MSDFLRKRQTLGRGLQVSPVCIGMVEAPETIEVAFDHGVNLFFVSTDLHWPRYQATRVGLERLLGRGADIREQIVVVATSYVAQLEFLRAPFEELRADIAGLDRIDVLCAGGCTSAADTNRQAALAKLVSDGHCGARAVGASFHSRSCSVTALNQAELDLVFIRYNPLHCGAEADVFPHLQNTRDEETKRPLLYTFKSTTGYATEERLAALGLDDDVHRPPIADYYRFPLSQPQVDGVLCSPTRPEHVEELAVALAEGPLDPDEADHLRALARFASGA